MGLILVIGHYDVSFAPHLALGSVRESPPCKNVTIIKHQCV